MNGLANDRRSARTVAKVWRTALKTIFAWGLDQGLVKANPFKEIKLSVPKKTQERETKAFRQLKAHYLGVLLNYHSQPTHPNLKVSTQEG
jgi:hypothetical protein